MRSPSRQLPAMPAYLAIIPIVITVSLLALQLIAFNRFDPQPPLMFGIFIAAAIGVMRGWKWIDIEEGMFRIVIISLPAIAILLLIGILIGSWVASGTVPYMIYYGLQIISPQWFLVSGFILCSLMSLALGTSWGTTGCCPVYGHARTFGHSIHVWRGHLGPSPGLCLAGTFGRRSV